MSGDDACAEELTMIFELDSFSPKDVAYNLEPFFQVHHIPLEGFMLDWKSLKLSRLLDRMRGLPHFEFAGHGIKLDQGTVRNCKLDQLIIKSNQPGRIAWDEWVRTFATGNHFVEAWVVNVKYDYWQNAFDRLQYQYYGQEQLWEQLPKKSNGLPPPLEQVIVDTSANPGRRTFRMGYIEAIGATMWLGERFWELTGASMEAVFSDPMLNCSTFAPGILRVESAPQCFTSGKGESAEIQQRLRALLFPRA